MSTTPIWGQIAIGVLIAVLAATPVALIARRVNPSKGGPSRTVIAGGTAIVDQSVRDNSTKITNNQTVNNHHVVQQYLQRTPSRGTSSDDDSASLLFGVFFAVLAAVALFAVYSNMILLASVSVVATLVISAGLLTVATRQRFGSLPTAAITTICHVGLVAATTAMVWVLVLTTDRNGVSLAAARKVAETDGGRLPVSAMLDAFDISGVVLLSFLLMAAMVSFILALLAGRDLICWTAYLRTSSAIATGRNPSGWIQRRASTFTMIKPSSIAVTAIMGAFAIFLATGLLHDWTSDPVPTLTAPTPTQNAQYR